MFALSNKKQNKRYERQAVVNTGDVVNAPFNTYQEELIAEKEEKNWKGIFLAIAVIIIVISIVVTVIVLLKKDGGGDPKDETHVSNKEPFSFTDYNELYPKGFSATWLKGEDAYIYREEDGALMKYNCISNVTSLLMDNSTFQTLNTGSFVISGDQKYVLLAYEQQPIYRHTSLSKYAVYNLETSTLTLLKYSGMSEIFQYIGWSPTGHSVVIVQGNDIYYKQNVTDVTTAPDRLSSTGVEGIIYNAIPDWVYEEEVLSTDHALWWSPDGHRILYAVFNDTNVKEYYYPFYGAMDDSYGERKMLRYPKAGSENPTFSLRLVDLRTKHTIEVEKPAEYINTDHYFTVVEWKDTELFLIAYLNRHQNSSNIFVCNTTGQCKVNQKEVGNGGYVDLYTAPVFSNNSDHYFWVLPKREGSHGYFKHVGMIDVNTASLKTSSRMAARRWLTNGQYDVMNIAGYDGATQTLYYVAAPDPRQRHLYSVRTDSSANNIRTPTCITCTYDTECQYVSTSFSSSGKFYILRCLGPGVPYYVLKSTMNNTEVMLEDNKVFKSNISKKAMPKIEYFKIPIDSGETIHGKLLLPPGLNKEHVTQYPLLMYVYGGPNTQQVTQRFSTAWETYLCSSHKYIIAYADGRGGAARGLSFLNSNYHRLGTVEVEDTIKAAEYFKKLQYVDPNKMAIWGWSYGGYLTAAVLGRGTKTFHCGMSVAPVTDWIYYDTIYTERYMNTPQNNAEGYRLGNVSKLAAKFKDSKYLLVHGTGDDNVHFQNSAQFIRALVEENIYFRTQIYTDKQHGLRGGNTRTHLYTTLEDFLGECYNGYSVNMGYDSSTTKDAK